MIQTIEAVFDGKSFLPAKPIQLKPNTRVKIIIEPLLPNKAESTSFLKTAQSLNLDGPPDWSENTDNHFQQAGFHVLLREDKPLDL